MAGTAARVRLEADITTPTYRFRWWWIPLTIGLVAVISLAQSFAELGLFEGWAAGNVDTPNTFAWLAWAHLIGAAATIALFGAVRAIRRDSSPSLRYSERYLVGLGYGFVTSLATSVAEAVLAADSAGQAVEYSGAFMTASLLGMVLPVACIVGGLSWHLITRVPAGAATPQRPRRPIEDAE